LVALTVALSCFLGDLAAMIVTALVHTLLLGARLHSDHGRGAAEGLAAGVESFFSCSTISSQLHLLLPDFQVVGIVPFSLLVYSLSVAVIFLGSERCTSAIGISAQQLTRGGHRMKKTTAALTLLLAACAAQADVFSLWSSFRPSSSQGASAAASSAEEMLAAKKLWTEPVVVNGSELGLGIALVDADFETCAARLREAYPKAPCAGNADELLMEIKLENGRRLRVYIVRMPGIGPVMQFTMELPSKLAQSLNGQRNCPASVLDAPHGDALP
jgi:hypothetical protein